MIEDVDSLDTLIRDGKITSFGFAVDGAIDHAVRIKQGELIVRNDQGLPVIAGVTSTKAFGDLLADKYTAILSSEPRPAGRIASAFVFRASPNYYHFLVCRLPSLFALAALPEDEVAVAVVGDVPAVLSSLFADIVHTLAGQKKVVIQHVPAIDYTLDNVVVACRSSNAMAIRAVQDLRGLVLARMGLRDPMHEMGPLKLFVRRKGGTNGRNLLNQDEIESILVERGYESVDPGELTFEQQVVTFARASHIAGVEGLR